MNKRVLCVDDEPRVLDAFRRQLRRHCELDTATSGQEALEKLALASQQEPYAVVVSDMNMPGMDGITLLREVRTRWHETVRIMLTGNAELQTAVNAINEGDVFRFLTKPCSPEQLVSSIAAGIEQFRLVNVEKELLSKTLHGVVSVLVDVLSLVNPAAFSHSSQITKWVKDLCGKLQIEDAWHIEIAAMLSQLGCVAIPEDLLTAVYRGHTLTEAQKEMFAAHPRTAQRLLSKIPRLEDVSQIVLYQYKNFDGSGSPEDSRSGSNIPIGARILRVAIDFENMLSADSDRRIAFRHLNARSGYYDPEVLQALSVILETDAGYRVEWRKVAELQPGMIPAQDITTEGKELLITQGTVLTLPLVERLRNYRSHRTVIEPIQVKIPVEQSAEEPCAVS